VATSGRASGTGDAAGTAGTADAAGNGKRLKWQGRLLTDALHLFGRQLREIGHRDLAAEYD
jgi:hypothetical protein